MTNELTGPTRRRDRHQPTPVGPRPPTWSRLSMADYQRMARARAATSGPDETGPTS